VDAAADVQLQGKLPVAVGSLRLRLAAVAEAQHRDQRAPQPITPHSHNRDVTSTGTDARRKGQLGSPMIANCLDRIGLSPESSRTERSFDRTIHKANTGLVRHWSKTLSNGGGGNTLWAIARTLTGLQQPLLMLKCSRVQQHLPEIGGG
jgi:hypothetical protein